MKKRRKKILGILLSLAILFQATVVPVSALDAAGSEEEPQISDTELTEESTDESSEPSEPAEPTGEPSETDPTEVTEPNEPTEVPTEEPTEAPTEEPSEESTEEPTEAPKEEPTEAPTEEPTEPPTEEPSEAPTEEPTEPSDTEDDPDESGEGEGEGRPAITPESPLIGPMFIGSANLMRLSISPMSTNGSGIELSKTATYNTTTGKVDFEFQIYSTGEETTTTSTKPTDIILVLDQSGSMGDQFGNAYNYTTNNVPTSHASMYSQRNNLYVLVDGTYYKVTVERLGSSSSGGANRRYRYSYTAPIVGTVISPLDTVSDDIDGWHAPDESLPSGADWNFAMRGSPLDKIDVLKTAVASFISTIQAKSMDVEPGEDPIPHRISIVGFSDAAGRNYAGTQLLTVAGTSAIRFDNITNTHRSDSLMDVTTLYGQGKLTDAVNRISTYSYTSTNLGMQMARDILTATASTSSGRDRIVVMFTDGVPTLATSASFNSGVANGAITNSKSIKDLGHKVFTIGIFAGANNDSLPDNNGNETARANRFMHLVSSNYPTATAMDTAPGIGSPSNNFYYDSSDPASLYATFTSISETVGSTNTALDENTSMIDFLIPQLSPPIDPASVEITTADVYSFVGDDPVWAAETGEKHGAVASVDQTLKKVTVTGFSYKDHYVAETEGGVRGTKLIVRFSADVDPDFIGGNQIEPNLPESGVYLPPDGNNPPELLEPFPKPKVDIPLRFDFDTQPKAIYLKNDIEPWHLLSSDGTTFKINGTTYPLNGENNEYVNIVYTVSAMDNTVLGTYTIPAGATSGTWSGTAVSPEVKTEYKLTATVTPISTGTYSPIAPTKNDFIYVHVPAVTPTDQSIYLDNTTDLTQRFGPVTWVPAALGGPATVEGTPKTVTVSAVNPLGDDPLTNGGTTTFKPNVDTYFDVKLEIDGSDVSAQSVVTPTTLGNAQGRDFGIIVFYPGVVGTDETIWLGETTNVADRMTTGSWWTDTAGAPPVSGTAPTLTLTPSFQEGDNPADFGGLATFAATQDSRFNIRTFIGTREVTGVTRVTPSADGLAKGHHFTIFVRTAELIIKKEPVQNQTLDPNQTFIFDVAGPGGKTWVIAIQGADQQRLVGLAVGTYTITERESWSWRYEAVNPVQSITLNRGNANQNVTVTFQNSREDDKWLGGETYAINLYTPILNRIGGSILGIFQWIGGLKR